MQIEVRELDILLNEFYSTFDCENAKYNVKYEISTTVSVMTMWSNSMIITPVIINTL